MRSIEDDSVKEKSFAFRAGALAAFLLAFSSIAASLIYLTGNLRSYLGPLGYSLADFLYGPVWATSLVTMVTSLRERLDSQAPRRMNFALMISILTGALMVLTACIRSANRLYHLAHPELALENNQSVLAVWAALVAGVSGAGWHFLGWMQLLLGSAGWSSQRLPRALCVFLLITGSISLFVYAIPVLEGFANAFAVIWSVWLGIYILKTNRKKFWIKGNTMFREMRRKAQQLPNNEAIQILESCTSGVLAVAGDDGYPYAVPLSYAYDDGKIYFHFATEGHKLDAIKRNDKASFCVIHTDEVIQETFTTQYRSVIVFGRAKILTDDKEKRRALECLVEKYSPNFISQGAASIERNWDKFCAGELRVEHMTGKAAKEFIKK